MNSSNSCGDRASQTCARSQDGTWKTKETVAKQWRQQYGAPELSPDDRITSVGMGSWMISARNKDLRDALEKAFDEIVPSCERLERQGHNCVIDPIQETALGLRMADIVCHSHGDWCGHRSAIQAFKEMLSIGIFAEVVYGAGGRRRGNIGKSRWTCNSFTPGTKVLLANGKTKPIEKIKVGDKVLATDPKTGKTIIRTVSAAFSGTNYDYLVQIIVDTDGKHGDRTGVIIATEHHLFWNQTTRTWTRADQLTPQTQLRTPNGHTVRVTHAYYAFGHPPVHDLTITDTHSFYVQADATSVLVHNAGPESCALGKVGEDAAGITKNTEKLRINGRERIPDELTGRTIGEVKNVKYQYLSTQLRDYLDYAQQNSLQFNLYVRKDTQLSQPLQDLVDSGGINLIRNIP
jgi:restriction endonuclease fold toxin 7 of polymorphic toxin system/pretoxin HINT domain-containing protein